MFSIAVTPALDQHVPVPVCCCGLSLLIMCSAATRPVSLILLIRETDTQSCTQRMEPQPFPTRHGGYGRLADEQNPQRQGCLDHTWCWSGICTSDVASPSKSGSNQCHSVYCHIFDSEFEGLSLLADSCECSPWPCWLLCHTRSVNGKRDTAKHKRFCLGRP